MKVVILCKRAPQSRDLWTRPYGRFFYLAKQLAEMGDEVHLLLLSYNKESEFKVQRDGITWHSINLMPNPLRYYRAAISLVKNLDADWIIGFSDTYFGICAEFVGRQTGAMSLIDAYDNYESYIPWFKPLHWLWRRALRNCTGITAAGPGLLKLMSGKRKNNRSAIIEMAADPQFTPGNKRTAREKFGLPQDRPIIAYSGSLYRNRGINELFQLIDCVGKTNPEASWVFSGRLEHGVRLPANCNHLGYVEDDAVVDIARSADALLCVNKPGAFGDFSYPVKIYEAMAVGTPVVAFRTKSVSYVMRDQQEGLVPFGDIASVAKKIGLVIKQTQNKNYAAKGWHEIGTGFRERLICWGRNLNQ